MSEAALVDALNRNTEVVLLAASLARHPGCDRACGRLATHDFGICPPMCDEHTAELRPNLPPEYPPKELPGARRVRRLEALLFEEELLREAARVAREGKPL